MIRHFAVVIEDALPATVLVDRGTRQHRAARTAVGVALRVVAEGLLGKNRPPARCLAAGALRLGHEALHAGAFARRELIGLVVALVGHGLKLLHLQFLLGRHGQRAELPAVIGRRHDVLAHDELVPGSRGHRHVVAEAVPTVVDFRPRAASLTAWIGSNPSLSASWR